MWVVKLGGALERDGDLRAVLDTLAGAGAGRLVIVPGGGTFADLVRERQRNWRFDNGTAHAMAVLAMAQYGW